MPPPWISTTLNAQYFDDEVLEGKIFEAKALLDQERLGYFIGVILESWLEGKEHHLRVQVCGASEKKFLDTVTKKWLNPCHFFLSRKTTGESLEIK